MNLAKLRKKLKEQPEAVRFDELHALCEEIFGAPRSSGGSHVVFKTPWPGDPRVNIQRTKGGKAKPYQVRQVLKAIEKMEHKHD